MVTFIDQHRATYGVEPICPVVPIAPSTYFRWKAQQDDPTKRSARARRDDDAAGGHSAHLARARPGLWAQKVWKQMGREGLREARCRVGG